MNPWSYSKTTKSAAMRNAFVVAENVAVSRANIMILGESGTGKELMARHIHQLSQRAKGPFVAVNCAAMPEGLLESELFGFEKGAFTGAQHSKPGKFELAHDGTFLLDEITEMPLVLQAKLLRVVQQSEVERLGGRGPKPINVRIISTSNRDMKIHIQQGRFREDLFYRLNVVAIHLPALRDRAEDIEALAQHFLKVACERNEKAAKRLSNEAMQAIHSHPWPGNVRELENVIERSCLVSKSEQIQLSDLGLAPVEVPSDLKLRAGMTIDEAERLLIQKTLEHTNQNRTRAADLLGISVRTLRNKISEYSDGSLEHKEGAEHG